MMIEANTMTLHTCSKPEITGRMGGQVERSLVITNTTLMLLHYTQVQMVCRRSKFVFF